MILLRLIDRNSEVVSAWAASFAGVAGVLVAQGDIFAGAPADAIVSPANSFGWMDGGIDLAYLRRFGFALQTRLQARIAERWGGELPVGEAEVVETGASDIPLMISAPTMVFPGPVPDSENAYLALRAALRAAAAHGGIRTVLCPGLCTLTGRMPPRIAAAQMRRAYDECMAAAGGVVGAHSHGIDPGRARPRPRLCAAALLEPAPGDGGRRGRAVRRGGGNPRRPRRRRGARQRAGARARGLRPGRARGRAADAGGMDRRHERGAAGRRRGAAGAAALRRGGDAPIARPPPRRPP